MPVDQLTGEVLGVDNKPLIHGLQGQDADQAAWLALDLQNRIRFNHATDTWHLWDAQSGIWKPDKTREVVQLTMKLAQQRAGDLALSGDPRAVDALKLVRRLYSINRTETALEVLATLDGYKTDGSDWDAEPYYLGCANGVVDLRTGELIPGLSPLDSKVTKCTNVVFDPKARTEHFIPFLKQITSGDDELAAFFIEWFGYSLFGRNWEQKFLILTGRGRNGKGALTHAVRFAIGDYDAEASQGIYMKSRFGSTRSNEARSDLMKLRGARYAIMSEPEGGQFNEELLKAHTGGDPIIARPLYRTEMRWEPTHTITFLTNQPPSVDDIGPAMAERVLVADFRERYEGANADTTLYDKLEAEAPGILALMVGAASVYWRERQAGKGLWYPERVVRASKAYIDSNDPIGQAIEDAFVVEKGAKAQSRDLYKAYSDWHATADDPNEVLSISAFAILLQRKGFSRRKTRIGNVYLGIRPKGAMETALDDE
jgi:putative DNA primase/helicase